MSFKSKISGNGGNFENKVDCPEGDCFTVKLGEFSEEPQVHLELVRWQRPNRQTEVSVACQGITTSVFVRLSTEALEIDSVLSTANPTYSDNTATVIGPGAIAQGPGSLAVGAGGIAVGGDLKGGVHTDSNGRLCIDQANTRSNKAPTLTITVCLAAKYPLEVSLISAIGTLDNLNMTSSLKGVRSLRGIKAQL